MQVSFTENGTVLTGAVLNIQKTFECGQCFRFIPDGDGYSGVAFGRALHVTQDGDAVLLYGVRQPEYEEIWARYFDLDRDYDALSAAFCNDETLRTAYTFSRGIRILCSRGKRSVPLSSRRTTTSRASVKSSPHSANTSGTPIEGTPFYAFPTAERLASAGTEGLARVRCGFRAKYVADAAEKVASGTLDLQALRNQPYEAAKAALMTIYGVGTKVADCVLLFSLGFYEAFPIDVWVKKVISKYYGKSFDGSRFGAYAGIAQQYLFYYERSICGR